MGVSLVPEDKKTTAAPPPTTYIDSKQRAVEIFNSPKTAKQKRKTQKKPARKGSFRNECPMKLIKAHFDAIFLLLPMPRLPLSPLPCFARRPLHIWLRRMVQTWGINRNV